LNHVLYMNPELDLEHLMKLPPLHVLECVLRLQISDQYQSAG
jgi:hypothetical protein